MHTFDLIVTLTSCSVEDIDWALENLLQDLYSTNQVIHGDFQLIRQGDQLRIPVTCPEADSLAPRYCMPRSLKYIDQLRQLTHQAVAIQPTGRTADSTDYEVPESSSWYILRGDKAFSPVICGDTYQPVPLYRLPATTDYHSYQNINIWHWTYGHIDGLWRVNHYGERYALGQLQQVHSPLSKEGRALCTQLEQLTGVPVYYFLANRRGWSEKEDRSQRCPVTGSNWLIEGATFNDFIGFKSDTPRLVSELSSMVRCRMPQVIVG